MNCKILIIIAFILFNSTVIEASLCGDSDDRTPSFDPKIARIRNQGRIPGSMSLNNNCTATLISSQCMITAKHCKTASKYVEFAAPASTGTGQMRNAAIENIYEVIPESIQEGMNIEEGEDWLVFQVKPNQLTQKLPGDLYGFYEIDDSNVFAEEDFLTASLTGYGIASGERHRSQQTQTNQIISWDFSNFSFRHQMDSMSGNSGSAIIHEKSKKIIGIHSHGGCSAIDQNAGNLAVMIYNNQNLLTAIEKCIYN